MTALHIFIFLHFVLNVQEQSMLEGHVTNDEKQMNNVQLRQLLRDYKQQKTQFVVMLLPCSSHLIANTTLSLRHHPC